MVGSFCYLKKKKCWTDASGVTGVGDSRLKSLFRLTALLSAGERADPSFILF
jgi:hypothetical protein